MAAENKEFTKGKHTMPMPTFTMKELLEAEKDALPEAWYK